MHISNPEINPNKFPPRLKYTLTLDSNECGDLNINHAVSLFPGDLQHGVRRRLQELKNQNEFNNLNGGATGLWVIFEFLANDAEGPWIYARK